MATRYPLVVIVGPTASGKTDLAIRLAEQLNGEIICADSRTIYKGMDVGTAKPSLADQARMPHWGLDLVEPNERFTAADFKQYAVQKMKEIRKRRHIPFLVGGSGLYIDSVIFDYKFGGSTDMTYRDKLNRMTLEQLCQYCYDNNIDLPDNSQNKRYVVRVIEQKGINNKRRDTPISTSIIVGISTDKDKLRTKIRDRAEQLFENGVVEEAILLGKKYGWQNEAMTGNIYQIVNAYLKNELDKEKMIEKNTTLDWRLAKKQITWFKRNPYIVWLDAKAAESYIKERLAIEQ